MNESTVIIAILGSAAAAVGNLGSAAIGYLAKRREAQVQLEISDRERIQQLFSRIDALETKLTDRDERIDALENEVAALHIENAELRELLEQHKITPPRPRMRVVATSPKESA